MNGIWIDFGTLEKFKIIVRGLNTLNSCLKDIEEFAKITLQEKLNTNQRPLSPKKELNPPLG